VIETAGIAWGTCFSLEAEGTPNVAQPVEGTLVVYRTPVFSPVKKPKAATSGQPLKPSRITKKGQRYDSDYTP
jgi:hypothetical protein